MEGQRIAVLATQEGGVPSTDLVAFAFADNLKYLLFVIPRETTKFRSIIANPYVSLFIDNRASDIVSVVGISVNGKASEIDDVMKEEYLQPYLERHPDLADFAWAQENALVSIDVSRYTIVRNFARADVIDPQGFTM